ncbi:MAG: porin [Gammaproteobacteria bacterium]|nr:porin [Gammaproteobacteria bacterium]
MSSPISPSRKLGLAIAIGLLCGTAAAEHPPSADEMWRIIQEQQNQIAELKAKLTQTDQKVEATGAAVEQVSSNAASTSGAAASWAERTKIGGYGELHYNNLEGEGGASDKDEIDLHRVVLFFGHEFNERTRFFSEIEYEHANTEANGVVELEQAYIDFDLTDTQHARAGMFLLPVGIMNETHEPPTFYGVERNPVEKNIVPVTWSAGGASLFGELGRGFSYDLAAHEGLNTSAANDYLVREGRQSTSEADASNLAYTARLKWTGMPGVELAASLNRQTDLTQGADSSAGSANLFETHGIFSRGPFTLKALYAQWDLDGSGPAAIGADEQSGWYVEPSYKLNDQWGVFTRYNLWDNAAGDSTGSEKKQWDVGMNFWPHPDVVVKADYQQQDNDSGANQDGFNLGVGYQF